MWSTKKAASYCCFPFKMGKNLQKSAEIELEARVQSIQIEINQELVVDHVLMPQKMHDRDTEENFITYNTAISK